MFSKYIRLFLNKKQLLNSEQQKRILEIGPAVTKISRLAFSPHGVSIFDAKKQNLIISRIVVAMQ